MHTSILSRLDLINWLQHKYFTAKTRQHGSDSIAFFLFQTTQGVKMAKHNQNKISGRGKGRGWGTPIPKCPNNYLKFAAQ